jgi:site-specific DNA recombinase
VYNTREPNILAILINSCQCVMEGDKRKNEVLTKQGKKQFVKRLLQSADIPIKAGLVIKETNGVVVMRIKQTSSEPISDFQIAPKIKRVALYLRVSTEEQAKDGHYGLEVQEERLRQFCASQGYELSEAHVYRDGGFSGTLDEDERPALKQAFIDAERKQFDLLIVYRLDRLFRNQRKLLNALARLVKCGVSFQSSTEAFETDTPSGRLMLQILGSFAEHERETIRDRMMAGKARAAKDGKWVTGLPPYGYRVDKETKHLVVCEEEAKVVKQMFDWLVDERCSLREITRRAGELKFPTPKHATIKKRLTYDVWWKKTVNRILINEAYTGTCYFRKYKRPFGYLSSVAEGKGLRPNEDWIPITVPALISRERFETGVRQLQKNKEEASRNTKRQYLYGHLIYDGNTGLRLGSGYQSPRKKASSMSLGKYYHSEYRHSRSQDAPRVQYAESRINPIWDCLVGILSDPDNTLPKLEEYTFKNSNRKKSEQKLIELTTQITTLKDKEQRIAYAFIEGGFAENEYKDQLSECRKRIHELEDERNKCQQLVVKQGEQKNRGVILKRLFKQVQARLETTTYEDKYYILRLFIERISLFPDKNYAEVFFRFPMGTTIPQNVGAEPVPGKNMLLALHVKTLSEKERRREVLKATPGMNHTRSSQ